MNLRNAIDYQCAVNGELLARRAECRGEYGGLLSLAEMQALDEAFRQQRAPADFVAALLKARHTV